MSTLTKIVVIAVLAFPAGIFVINFPILALGIWCFFLGRKIYRAYFNNPLYHHPYMNEYRKSNKPMATRRLPHIK